MIRDVVDIAAIVGMATAAVIVLSLVCALAVML
jgi:hypothetical protein